MLASIHLNTFFREDMDNARASGVLAQDKRLRATAHGRCRIRLVSVAVLQHPGAVNSRFVREDSATGHRLICGNGTARSSRYKAAERCKSAGVNSGTPLRRASKGHNNLLQRGIAGALARPLTVTLTQSAPD